MQLALDGLKTESEHSLALQTTPPVTQPQELPAPSVVNIQRSKVFSTIEEQAAATAQLDPL